MDQTTRLNAYSSHRYDGPFTARVDDPVQDPDGGGGQVNLQEKTVTANGVVTPDDGYDGLSSVTVAVPSSGGGGSDVKVQTGRKHSIIATENGIINDVITPSVSYDAMDKVEIEIMVDVQSGGSTGGREFTSVSADAKLPLSDNSSAKGALIRIPATWDGGSNYYPDWAFFTSLGNTVNITLLHDLLPVHAEADLLPSVNTYGKLVDWIRANMAAGDSHTYNKDDIAAIEIDCTNM